MLIIDPIYIALLVIVLITYKIKNPYLRWFFILSPPLPLLLLVWIPWDISTTQIWIHAIIAVLFSLISVLLKTVGALIRKVKGKKLTEPTLRIKLIRPVLVICIVIGAFILVNLSLKSANVYAVEIAKEIQNSCDINSVCPEIIEGWKISDRENISCSIMYGNYGTKYPVRYKSSDDKCEFSIVVRHNIDESFYVTGGVNQKLKAGYSYCGNPITVDVNTLERIESAENLPQSFFDYNF